MTSFSLALIYTALIAYIPVVYSSAISAHGGRWRNLTFTRTVAKDFLRTFPMLGLVWAPIFAFPQCARWYALIIHILFAPMLILEIAHVRQFGARVGLNTFYSLFATNKQEFIEYCRQTVTFWNWVVVLAIYLLPAAAILLVTAQGGPAGFWRVALSLACLVAFIPFPRNLTKKGARFKIGYILNPYSSFPYHYVQFKRSYAELARQIAAHSAPPFAKITSSIPADEEETYIICIGESSSALHHSYCGYARDTNEFTDRLGTEIRRFTGVRSPFAQTLPVLEKVLTFATTKEPDRLWKQGSVIDYFKEAGFKTYWISNQYALDDNTPLTAITSHADKSKCLCFSDLKRFERSVDGALFSELKKILGDGAKKKIVFLHMIGSHSAYVNRYPPEFVHYEGTPPGKEWLNIIQAQSVNTYDDSIRYTDWIISEFINIIKAAAGDTKCAYLLYFADHGEDVYDTTRDKILGHSQLANEPMTSVPFMLWTSPRYNALRPDVARRKAKSFYNTENVINTIIDLSSLSNEDFDISKSILVQ